MSTIAHSHFGNPALPRALVNRWLWLGVLLLIELIGVSLLFDTDVLPDDGRWWAQLLQRLHLVPKLALGIIAAIVIFRGAALRAQLLTGFDRQHVGDGWRPALLLHLVTLSVFIALTLVIRWRDQVDLPTGKVWLGSWGLLCLVTAGTWATATFSGFNWRQVVRPLLRAVGFGIVIAVVAWISSEKAEELWEPLGAVSLWTSYGLLRLLGADTVIHPEGGDIGTETFLIRVATGCSGYEGIGLITVFLGTYLYVYREQLRFPQAFVLLPLGVVLAWAGNVLRIASLVAVGTWISPELALGAFHSQAGWLAFLTVAIGLVAVAGRWRWFADVPIAWGESSRATANPAAPFLAPFLSFLAAGLCIGTIIDDPQVRYPFVLAAPILALGHYRRLYVRLFERAKDFDWSGVGLAVGSGVLAFGLWMLAASQSSLADGASDPSLAGLGDRWLPLWLACRVLGYLVVIPLVEELAFRGCLMRWLISTEFETVPLNRRSVFAMVASSLLFGLLHGRFWMGGTVAGLLYAVAVTRRGRLADAVVAHATTNGLIAAYVGLTGDWSVWN